MSAVVGTASDRLAEAISKATGQPANMISPALLALLLEVAIEVAKACFATNNKDGTAVLANARQGGPLARFVIRRVMRRMNVNREDQDVLVDAIIYLGSSSSPEEFMQFVTYEP